MLTRLDQLARDRQSFGFETTLASRSFAPRIRRLLQSAYECHLVFLWLPSADLAVARVADRVRLGGHAVPEQTVRRRYRVVSPVVWKFGWRILPVGEVHDQPAALAGGHRRSASWARVSGKLRARSLSLFL